ncbi:MAG: FAD:protein FMN transferase [Planctomycetota bacterium]
MTAADLHTIVVGRDAMGCRFEAVFNAGEVPEATELGCQALDVVDEIEARISVYRSTSELALVNAAAGGAWVRISADTFALLSLARELHAATAGAFDIAAGPLVRAWGFLARQGRTPAEADLVAALAASGTAALELDPDGPRARLARAGAELNPGAIGKGWAIDRAIEWLAAAGVPSVLVHGGQSSVRARGVQGPALPGRAGWKVGLRHPLRPGRRLATLTLVDRALGTSGSGTQFFIERGRRLGHILDPRTGRPAEGVLSATVVAPTGAEADAWATALYVLGPAGVDRAAPPGSERGAVLVLPGPADTLRIVVANLTAAEVAIEAEPGLEVTWPQEPGSAGTGAEPTPRPA